VKRAVIIVAGGQGLRMGHTLPKQFIPLNGKPVLMHTLELFYQWDATAVLVVTLPEAHCSYWEMLCKELNCCVPHQIATGGETRFHSVRNSLPYTAGCDLVGVHDGVRPFTTIAVIEDCFTKAERYGAVIPVVPVTESIRQQCGTATQAVDRKNYCIVQTPQVFRRDWLKDAYKQPFNPSFTDDATVVEATGKTIYTVDGNRENIKITTPLDLAMAEKTFHLTMQENA